MFHNRLKWQNTIQAPTSFTWQGWDLAQLNMGYIVIQQFSHVRFHMCEKGGLLHFKRVSHM
jgi:hypothetical protein